MNEFKFQSYCIPIKLINHILNAFKIGTSFYVNTSEWIDKTHNSGSTILFQGRQSNYGFDKICIKVTNDERRRLIKLLSIIKHEI